MLRDFKADINTANAGIQKFIPGNIDCGNAFEFSVIPPVVQWPVTDGKLSSISTNSPQATFLPE